MSNQQPSNRGRSNSNLSSNPTRPQTRAPSAATSRSGNSSLPPLNRHESESSLPQSSSSLNLPAQPNIYSSEQNFPSRFGASAGRFDPAFAYDPRNAYLGPLPGYGFPPGGPLVTEGYIPAPGTEYGTVYEPQGELQLRQQPHIPVGQEFVTPLPVRPSTAIGPPRQTAQGMTTTAQTTNLEMATQSQTATAMTTRAGQKRKAESRSESSSTLQQSEASPSQSTSKRPSVSQAAGISRGSASASPRLTRRQQVPAAADVEQDDDDDEGDDERPQERRASTTKYRTSTEAAEAEMAARKIAEVAPHLTTVLPAGKVFPIQIGSDLFRLSGASISSDAPSYFSHYFGEQLIQTGGRANQVKTLYIDRDPQTFKDIALHLQGYYVRPRDEEHFVRLFADAQFYSLPRLTQQLFKSEIFIQVGDRHFQIPRDIFSAPGDSPNFFSLGFAHFFSTPSEVFPGLDRQTLLRPPSILPPSVANRSGETFADLLRILQGYDVNVRDAAHRAELLRDARYFHLKGVEQKLIPVEISLNALRGRSEIAIRLEDIRQSGINFLREARPTLSRNPSNETDPRSESSTEPTLPIGWITYQRPYIDDKAHDLILEIASDETTKIDMTNMRATFSGQTKARITSLFSVVANKLNLPAMVPLGLMLMQSGGGIAAQPASPANSGVSGDKVRIHVDSDAYVELDGDVVEWDENDETESSDENMTDVATALPKVRRWKRDRPLNKEMEWIVQKGQWRLRMEAAEDAGAASKVEVVLCAIRLEGYTRETYRNKARGFLA